MISINIYEIIMQLLNFLLLLYLLNRFVIRALVAFIQKRADGIQQNIDAALHNKNETEALLAQQKELLKQARQEAQGIRQKAEEATKKEKEQAMEQAQKEAKALLEQTQKDIHQQVKQVKHDVVNQMGHLLALLSRQLLQQDISPEKRDQLVDQALTKLKTHDA